MYVEVYTPDSCICRAAQHAGALGPNGGLFLVRLAPGAASYSGSVRHGVETLDHRWCDASITIQPLVKA
jgi:hypothetical protein